MQCLTRSPEHQSGCVPSDSPQMLYGSLWICVSQSRAEASPTLFAPCRLDHARVGWRVLRFLGKTFFAASLELTRRRPPSDASRPETLPSDKRFWIEPVLVSSSERRRSRTE